MRAHVRSLLVNRLPLDDEEDKKAGKRDDAVEEQVGEQQPGPAADGRGGDQPSFDYRKSRLTLLKCGSLENTDYSPTSAKASPEERSSFDFLPCSFCCCV